MAADCQSKPSDARAAAILPAIKGIVDKATFYKVQDILDDRTKPTDILNEELRNNLPIAIGNFGGFYHR